MGYRNLRACIEDLKRHGHLVEIEQEIDPHLEAAALQRRLYEAGGPAVLIKHLRGNPFPAVCNLFGTLDRARFLFRDTLAQVRTLVDLKARPPDVIRTPKRLLSLPGTAYHLLPRHVRTGPILDRQTNIDQLPPIVSWPNDGGPFVTLPAVYTEDPDHPGLARSNLGMYRVQLSGNDYIQNREVGLHYQIHRGIGVHHAAAIRRGEPLRVNICVGGPPALPLAAVMPLPEGLTELGFAGALGGRRLALVTAANGLPMPAEADFVISGTIDPTQTKPEGPFGDHLGYYSLTHEFPVMRVDRVYHRADAIWPFTSVGRPPQEDTTFGDLIHELTGPLIPTVLPGVKAVNAVDAAGVHPLLLAIGSERYTPYDSQRRPMELLTQANAILGQGQMSLAKFLLIIAQDDDPHLDIHDIAAFFRHLLERVDWRRDLHFQTQTTIDTLDYSGDALNQGSKLVIAAAGPPIRTLGTSGPPELRMPPGFAKIRIALPGVLVIESPRYAQDNTAREQFRTANAHTPTFDPWPLIVLVDDADFTAQSLSNWLWVAFTRTNPAPDIDGMGAFTHQKHWGCTGPLILDARIKPHHAPPLEDDPAITNRINALAAPGAPLHGIL